MSNQFKGKKLVIINDYQKADYGTYPKMILRNTELTLLDKLILIVCHSYPTKDKNGNAMQWTLAYTRIAKEINCDQSHLICRWKHLINCNYIIDGIDTYTINYDAIINNFKVPPIIDNKRTKIGFHQSGATSVTLPAEVTPAGSVTPAAETNPATRVTHAAADRVTPVEQQGFSDTATRLTPAEAARVTPANEYKEEKQKENQEENQELKNNRGLDLSLDLVSSYIENDRLLKSVYFGKTLNEKLVKVYLSSPNEIKIKLSYHQYEALYLYLLIFGYLRDIKDVNREYVIQLLNKDFDITNSSIIRQLGTYVEQFIAKEPQFYKKLENFKL